MKTKTKKILYKVLKIIWIIFGIFLALLLLLSFIKTQTYSGSGISGIGGAIGVALFFAIAVIALSIYGGLTLIFLIIKFVYKKWKKKKLKK